MPDPVTRPRSSRARLALALAVAALTAVPAIALAAPAPPEVTGTDPASPANDNTPQVLGTVEAGTVSVDIHTTPDCSDQPVGNGTVVEFETVGIEVTVPDNSTTSFYATASDAVDPDPSACSTTFATYVEDSTAPAAPTVTGTEPVSPANDNNPVVKGTADQGTTVSIYSTADCSGSPLATGAAALFAGAGIPVAVPDDTTTTFRATATDQAGNVSSCSATSAEYVEDSTAEAPVLTGTDPASAANENNPRVTGTAEAGSTVELFTTADCSGQAVATGDDAELSSAGIAVTVPDDSTTSFYGRVTDAAGNVSPCSAPLTYVEDSTAPEAPTVARTNPAGPANDNQPEVLGGAEDGSQVRIYAGPGCSGSPLATGAAAGFASPGLTVTVPDDSVTSFHATATDAAGNVSPCSPTSVSYVEDSTAPGTLVTFAPGGKTRDRTPTFLFRSLGKDKDVHFICKVNKRDWKRCGTPKTLKRLSLRKHTFKVRAVDAAGNVDRTPAARAFRVIRSR
jgi:hypothetical protein